MVPSERQGARRLEAIILPTPTKNTQEELGAVLRNVSTARVGPASERTGRPHARIWPKRGRNVPWRRAVPGRFWTMTASCSVLHPPRYGGAGDPGRPPAHPPTRPRRPQRLVRLLRVEIRFSVHAHGRASDEIEPGSWKAAGDPGDAARVATLLVGRHHGASPRARKRSLGKATSRIRPFIPVRRAQPLRHPDPVVLARLRARGPRHTQNGQRRHGHRHRAVRRHVTSGRVSRLELWRSSGRSLPPLPPSPRGQLYPHAEHSRQIDRHIMGQSACHNRAFRRFSALML